MCYYIQILFVSTVGKMLIMKLFLHRNGQGSSTVPSSSEADSFSYPVRYFAYVGQNCLQDLL